MSRVYRARASRMLGIGAAFGIMLAAIPAYATPTPPSGIWYTKDQESIIKVHPCATEAGHFCGTLVWLKEPNEKDGSPKRDNLNKDPTKRTHTIVGLQILVDMKEDDDHWTGKAYNPDDGKLYDITFKVKEANDEADLRGCILGFLCQTETFTRAPSVPGGEPVLSDATPAKKHKAPKK